MTDRQYGTIVGMFFIVMSQIQLVIAVLAEPVPVRIAFLMLGALGIVFAASSFREWRKK